MKKAHLMGKRRGGRTKLGVGSVEEVYQQEEVYQPESGYPGPVTSLPVARPLRPGLLWKG